MIETVTVFSADCTHVLPTEGITLTGGTTTIIPAVHLDRCLRLPGVTQVIEEA